MLITCRRPCSSDVTCVSGCAYAVPACVQLCRDAREPTRGQVLIVAHLVSPARPLRQQRLKLSGGAPRQRQRVGQRDVPVLRKRKAKSAADTLCPTPPSDSDEPLLTPKAGRSQNNQGLINPVVGIFKVHQVKPEAVRSWVLGLQHLHVSLCFGLAARKGCKHSAKFK